MSSGACTGVSNIAPVGTPTMGLGKYGHLDLAGNVFEWSLDWFGKYTSCTDCANATPTSLRVIRGGYFSDVTPILLPTNRGNSSPADRFDYIGFRCARTP